MSAKQHLLSAAVIVAALGYFVDVYDLVLFLAVKNASLIDLGVHPDEMLEAGAFLLNCQNGGMLVGGLLWGLLGDKIGRTKVLFGSILMYSVGNICNAFVGSLTMYALLRFVAGVGLAGELGAGVTLVAELMPQRLRGYGTTIIACVGVFGAIAAGFVGDLLSWRHSYLIGGALGLALLFLRVSVAESELFKAVHAHGSSMREVLRLIATPRRLARFFQCILIGVPIWFIVGILLANSKDLAGALGVVEVPKAGFCIAICYFGLFVGDVIGGLLSQYLQSRKRPIAIYLSLCGVAPLWFLTRENLSLMGFYANLFAVGCAGGYWVLVVTLAAEQFGTNVRATVTTSIPNFIRGAIVPVSAVFLALRPTQGILDAAMIVGVGVCVLSTVCLFTLEETFSRDLDFLETR
jgi:putative MFS transporter